MMQAMLSDIRPILQARSDRFVLVSMAAGLSIAQIAQQCGFEDPSYFTLRFRETYGVPPKAYRREMAGQLQQNPASTRL